MSKSDRIERAGYLAMAIRPRSAAAVLCAWAAGYRRFNQLARRTGLGKTNLSNALRSLVDKGLLSVHPAGYYETGPMFETYRSPQDSQMRWDPPQEDDEPVTKRDHPPGESSPGGNETLPPQPQSYSFRRHRSPESSPGGNETGPPEPANYDFGRRRSPEASPGGNETGPPSNETGPIGNETGPHHDHEPGYEIMTMNQKKRDDEDGNDPPHSLTRAAAMRMVRDEIPEFSPNEGWNRRFARWEAEGKLWHVRKVIEMKKGNPGRWKSWSAALSMYCDQPHKLT